MKILALAEIGVIISENCGEHMLAMIIETVEKFDTKFVISDEEKKAGYVITTRVIINSGV